MASKTLIFLDDERNPEDVFWIDYKFYLLIPEETKTIIVRNFEQFKQAIVKVNLQNTVISFDHDLQDFQEDSEKTGYDCMKWLVDYIIESKKSIIQTPLIAIHTKNPIGAENIKAYWLNFIKVYS